MAAQYSAILEHQPHECPTAEPARTLERFPADEIALRRIESHRPAQSGLQRMAALVHVVAVEIHAGLQTQRISRAEPGGCDALREQRLPRLGGLLRRQHDLEAVLAGISGAREKPRIDGGTREARYLHRLCA